MKVLELSQLALNIVGVLASVGMLGALLYAARWLWNRLRWRSLAKRVEEWAEIDFRAAAIDDHQLRLMTVNWLYEAEFSPGEIKEHLEFAVLFVRARIDYVLEQGSKR